MQVSRAVVEGGLFFLAAAVVVQSAWFAKSSPGATPLVAIDESPTMALASTEQSPEVEPLEAAPNAIPEPVTAEVVEETLIVTPPEGFERYFDGRPIRPVKTITMVVTAYSPDERSCDDSADGYTATNHSVWTNAMKLVAADTKLLPFGSMVSVPGYADGAVVPVLDRGGAIKGRRLDVLYPTHEIARQWGRRRLQVTVWEFADGKPTTLGHRKRG